jgi:tetratricopeptide (TPR) repeat protein
MKRQLLSVLGACLIICGATKAATDNAKAYPRTDRTLECGGLFNGVGPFDYRDRNVSAERRWMMQDTSQNHLEPALNRIRQGEQSAMVLKDLDFLLREFPNHYPALQALIQYDLSGGPSFGFRTTDCYLNRARRFAPDDPMVVLAEGYYFWKKGNHERARAAYTEALSTWPDSADINYNFGLYCLAVADYECAVRLARVAYKNEYPLGGLRDRLTKAGRWP